ncbi:MAG TPA: histidine phosphatase family protein [Pseudonocardiaceae bacterium]|jgi:broad specificity phosphatase PhoE|nr:histidine phosphatase family protein [Pseudonocardiaceae bacterium]
MRLVLVRHGQTASNVAKVLDTLPPGPPLTELGEQQALDLAEALADEPVIAVYASTALRAQQTAAPVAARHGLQVKVVDGVHEVYVGELEGRTDRPSWEGYHRTVTAWAEGDLDFPFPGGESGRDVVDRFLTTVREIRERHEDGTVVLVSHGGAARMAALALAANVEPSLAENVLLPNTGRIALEADGDGWRCVSWPGVELPVG